MKNWNNEFFPTLCKSLICRKFDKLSIYFSPHPRSADSSSFNILVGYIKEISYPEVFKRHRNGQVFLLNNPVCSNIEFVGPCSLFLLSLHAYLV